MKSNKTIHNKAIYTKQFLLLLPPKLHTMVKKQAAKKKMTMCNWVRRAIELGLANDQAIL